MTPVLKSLQEITAGYSIFEKDQVLTADQLNSVTEYLNDQTRLIRVNLFGVGVASGLRVSFSTQDNTVKVTKGIGITTDGDLLYYNNDVVFNRFRTYDDGSAFKYEYAPLFVNNVMIAAYELIAQGATDNRTSIFVLSEFNTQTQKNLNDMVAVLLMESYVNDPDICTGTDCDNLGQDCRNTPRLLLIDKASVSPSLKPAIATPSEAYRQLNAIVPDRPLIPASLKSINELVRIYRNVCTKIYSKLLVELDKIYPVCAAFLNGGSEFIGGGSVATAVATVSNGAVTAVRLTSSTGYTAPPIVVLSGGGGTGATATATLTPSAVAMINLMSGGTGYTSAPAVTITGGGGTGATATAALASRAVSSMSVMSGGTGYTSAPAVTITGGEGTGATATAALAGRAVSSISLMSTGAGYTSAPEIVFTGGGGTGVQATATLAPGAVGSISVRAGGTGYTSPPTVTLTGGGGTGATAVASLAPGSVGSITRTAGGSGYTSPPTVTLTGGGGTGAQATATVSAGVVTAINVTVSGTGYTSAPTVTITGGGGTGAAATAVLAGRAINLTLTTGGTGYTSAPTVTITGGGGTGAAATAVLAGRAIASLTLTAGGTDYTSAPTVTITGGGGTGATASATLVPGSVSSISVTAAGTGYTSAPTVTLTGGGGLGATATATLTPGTVSSISVTAAGTGYTSTPTVTLTGGGGSGATASVALTPAAVSNISVTAGGTGYTTAPTVTLVGGGGIGATARATVSAGVVTAVTITSGTGYVSTPAISFTGGGGIGATATATVSDGAVTAITLLSGGTDYTSAPTVTFTGGAPVPAAPISSGTWKTKLTEINARSDVGIQYYYDFLKDVGETYNQFRDLLFGDTTWCCPDLNAFPKHLLLGNLKPGPDSDENRTVFYPSPLISPTADALNHARFLIQKLDLLIRTFQVPTPSSVPIRITPSSFEDQPLEARAIPYYYPFNPTQPIYRNWNYHFHQRGIDVNNNSYYASLYNPQGEAAKPFEFQIGSSSFFRIEGHLGQKLDTALNTISQIIQTQNLPISVLAVKLESSHQLGDVHFKDLLSQYPGIEHFGGVSRGGTFVLLADNTNETIIADFMVPSLPSQRGGSTCTLQLKPSDNLAVVLNTLANGQDAHICFEPGTYTLPSRLVLQNKGHLILNGSGRGTRIMAPGIEAVIEFSNCKSVSISNCYFENVANQIGIPTGFTTKLEDFKGVLTFINCSSVELENVALRCAHQVVRSASCITMRQDSAVNNTQTRIRHCDLQVGYQQIGILLVNVERSQVEDNQIQVDRSNILPTLNALSSMPGYRLRLFPRLMANTYLGTKRPGDKPNNVKGTGATSIRYDESNVQITYAGQSIRFKSDLPTAAWQNLLATQNLFVQTRQDLRNVVKQLARQILLDDKFRAAHPVFDSWYQSINKQSGITAAQGIAVVGSRAQDVRILNNTIRGFLQGIHLGMRRFNRAGSVWLTGNRIEVAAPVDQIRERHGIYVSSCDSLIIESNYLEIVRNQDKIDGIRISGRLGRMVIVRHNHLIGFNPGIYFNPLDTYGTLKMQWLVADNIAPATSTFLTVVSNRPGQEGTQITDKVQRINNFQ